MADSARVFEEVRQEQEHTQHVEKARKQLEQQCKEMQVRLEESEANAMKGGKKAMAKLEQRVRELESELDGEQRRHGETQKTYRKVDRRLKEVSLQVPVANFLTLWLVNSMRFSNYYNVLTHLLSLG